MRQYWPPIQNNSIDDKRQHCELYRLLPACKSRFLIPAIAARLAAYPTIGPPPIQAESRRFNFSKVGLPGFERLCRLDSKHACRSSSCLDRCGQIHARALRSKCSSCSNRSNRFEERKSTCALTQNSRRRFRIYLWHLVPRSSV